MRKIVRVEKDDSARIEAQGTRSKFWTEIDGENWLYKQDDRNCGDDWAEVVVADICCLLGLPHALYELAELKENQDFVNGVVSKNFVSAGMELTHGNTLLGDLDSSYVTAATNQRYRVREHTVQAVAQIMAELVPYPDIEGFYQTADASFQFAGYLMLDALVANQDRHHENWGVISQGNCRYLASTYDHGASLARNEPVDRLLERMVTKDENYSLRQFARKAKSALYFEGQENVQLSTHQAFFRYCEVANVRREAVLANLDIISEHSLNKILEPFPCTDCMKIAKKPLSSLCSQTKHCF